MTARTGDPFPDNPGDAARWYLRHGLAPIPVPHRGKRPALDGWPQLRLAGHELDRHFPPGQPRNVGVLNGAPSGNLVDADLDDHRALRVAGWFLPPTAWVFGRPGAPRSHWLYHTSRPLDRAQEKYALLDGRVILELRGTGGQTVFPPSAHEETGEPIRWDTLDGTGPAPVELEQLQAAARLAAGAVLLAEHWPGPDSRCRDTAFLALAGGLLRWGLPAETVERLIGALCELTNDEEARSRLGKAARTEARQLEGGPTTGWATLRPLLRGDGGQVIERLGQWLAPRQPAGAWETPVPLGDVPEAPPFPLGVLPGPVRQFVEAVADAIPCPPDYVAVPLLVLAGSAIGTSRQLVVKSGHSQFANLYAGVVGPPGCGKSPALGSVLACVTEAEEALMAAWKARLEGHRAAQDRFEAAHKQWCKAPDTADRPPEPARPTLERLTVNDATAEALVPILCENPRGVALVRDELTGWVEAMNQYREGGRGADRQLWLSGWSCASMDVDRKKTHAEGPLRVTHPFVSVVGGLTPDRLGVLRGDRPRRQAEQDGFLDRVLLSYPAELPPEEENWAAVPESSSAAWAAVHARLRSLPLEAQPGKTWTRGVQPGQVRLTECGRAGWSRFTAAHAAELRSADFPGEVLRGPWSKLKTCCLRLALIVHYLRWACGEVDDGAGVDGEDMRRAEELVRYFKGHARKVYALLDADPEAAKARKVVRWLAARRLQRFTQRDAHRALKGTLKTADDVESALGLVERHGYIRRETRDEPRGRGRPASAAYEVHPSLTGRAGPGGREPDDTDPDGPPGDGPPGDPRPGAGPYGQSCRAGLAPAVSGICGPSVPGVGGGLAPADTPETLDTPGQNGHKCQKPPAALNIGISGNSVPGPGSAPEGPFTLVIDPGGLAAAADALAGAGLVALDLETTGLDPRADRVRLLTVTADGGPTYLVDCFAVDPAPLFPLLAQKRLVCHHGAFDLGFLARLGFEPGAVHDTLLLSQLLHAGEPGVGHSLAECCRRELGLAIDKGLQRADWSGRLTPEMLRYAARDAQVLPPLLDRLNERVEAAGLAGAASIEARALPALVWMAGHGVGVDRDRWDALAAAATEEKAARLRELSALAPPCQREGELFGSAWNWDSPADVLAAFRAQGLSLAGTADAELAGVDHPLAEALRRYRSAAKRASTCGADWAEKHVRPDGRVYPRWLQCPTASGRMACCAPNMQQLPRDRAYRRCVVAPPGRVLVKADYSQIELRIAAKISGDRSLQEAYRQGEDVHAQTARLVLGVSEVTKEHRQLAKAINFGLLYGMGAEGFRTYARAKYGLALTEAEAAEYRAAFFRAYPGLRVWHRSTPGAVVETRTLCGRRRLGVARYTEKLNTPVQGTGADGLKAALGLLWERRAHAPGAFPVLAVHDEVVVECAEGQADTVSAWLRSAMLEAMTPLLSPVPVEVEVQAAPSWGG